MAGSPPEPTCPQGDGSSLAGLPRAGIAHLGSGVRRTRLAAGLAGLHRRPAHLGAARSSPLEQVEGVLDGHYRRILLANEMTHEAVDDAEHVAILELQLRRRRKVDPERGEPRTRCSADLEAQLAQLGDDGRLDERRLAGSGRRVEQRHATRQQLVEQALLLGLAAEEQLALAKGARPDEGVAHGDVTPRRSGRSSLSVLSSSVRKSVLVCQ